MGPCTAPSMTGPACPGTPTNGCSTKPGPAPTVSQQSGQVGQAAQVGQLLRLRHKPPNRPPEPNNPVRSPGQLVPFVLAQPTRPRPITPAKAVTSNRFMWVPSRVNLPERKRPTDRATRHVGSAT